MQGRGSEGGQCGEAGAKGAVLAGKVQAGLLFQEDCGKIPGSGDGSRGKETQPPNQSPIPVTADRGHRGNCSSGILGAARRA